LPRLLALGDEGAALSKQLDVVERELGDLRYVVAEARQADLAADRSEALAKAHSKAHTIAATLFTINRKQLTLDYGLKTG
jgi:hypothetical protein